MPGRTFSGELPPLSVDETAVRDKLRQDLQYLAETIGERNVRHPVELARAATWIEAELRAADYQPTRQIYEIDGLSCANLVAERRGTSLADEIVLLGAHYDSA